MKKVFLAIIVAVAFVFNSCSNKIELYADKGEYTIIYGMLDTSADTNFFKITKSFIGDVGEMAQNYDANNYAYDEIDVKFSGKFVGHNTIDTVKLDTISKWIPYDENSAFYSGCRQTYYYLLSKNNYKLKEGEEYTLQVIRKSDNTVATTKSTTINNFGYQKPPSTMPIHFTDVTTTTNTVEWRVPVDPYRSTAAYFEVTGYFRYKELQPGASEYTEHTIAWGLGSGKAESLLNTSTNLPYYTISYTPSALYSLLRNDEHLKNNSAPGVKRWYMDFHFSVSAIGEELYNYYLATNSTSAIQDIPNYSNVENGMGIMSSRITKTLPLEIAERTMVIIGKNFPEYGFQGLAE